MKVTISRHNNHGTCVVEEQEGDPKFYKETAFFHALKKSLIELGYDVIKKRMWKDGHLVDDLQFYIRTRKKKPDRDSFCIYQSDFMIRQIFEPWNEEGKVKLWVMYDIFVRR